MHVHLVGVAGTGMGTLAGLLKAAGHRVTGSDTAFYPPMGDALRRYGYPPAELRREPSAWELGGAALGDVPAAIAAGYRLLAFKRKLDRHFEGRARLDPQQGMEENLALNPGAWRHYPHFEMPRVPQLVSAGSSDS